MNDRQRGPTMLERLQLVERDMQNHAKSFTVYNQEIMELKDRVLEIEEDRQNHRVNEARMEAEAIARAKAIDLRFDHVELQLKGIKDNGNKIIGIVLGAFLMAAATWVLKGGLTLPLAP